MTSGGGSSAPTSMTGFGSAVVTREGGSVTAEVRSVNHRYLETSFRLPPGLLAAESRLRGLVASRLSRGKVDVTVTVAGTSQSPAFRLDEALFRSHLAACRAGYAAAGLPADAEGRAEELVKAALAAPGVVAARAQAAPDPGAPDPDVAEAAADAVGAAVEKLLEMRRAEGKALTADLTRRLAAVAAATESIRASAAAVPGRVRDRIAKRLSELLAPGAAVDPARLAQEAAVLAERADVSEELSRLSSHHDQFLKILAAPPCGRKLDFLIQEFVREANTVASKCGDAAVQAVVVDLKAELEKMREQIQNLE